MDVRMELGDQTGPGGGAHQKNLVLCPNPTGTIGPGSRTLTHTNVILCFLLPTLLWTAKGVLQPHVRGNRSTPAFYSRFFMSVFLVAARGVYTLFYCCCSIFPLSLLVLYTIYFP